MKTILGLGLGLGAELQIFWAELAELCELAELASSASSAQQNLGVAQLSSDFFQACSAQMS